MTFLQSFKGYLLSLKHLRKTRIQIDSLSETVKKVDQLLNSTLQTNATVPQTPKIPAKPDVVAVPKIKILVADEFHINSRNFPSLFEVLNHKHTTCITGIAKSSPEGELLKACGNYEDFERILYIYKEKVRALSKEDLYTLSYRNVPVVEFAIDEAVSASIASASWQQANISKTNRAIFEHLWNDHRETLRSACAACLFWTDYWADFKNIHQFDAAIVFSGSYIYGRVLLHLLTYTKAKTFVVESFATGYDFFFEERTGPIANQSRVRHSAYRERYLALKLDQDIWERHKIRAFNKLRNMKNKNVQQPPAAPLPREMSKYRIVLVLGQVVNDFSLISGCGSVLNSIPAYKELILRLLDDPDVFVAFKAHPWELKKQNVSSPLTEDLLRTWVDTLDEKKKARVTIFREQNIQQLFSVASFAVTLCSQSALEAALAGLKPVTIGGSFYSDAGFTSDFATAGDAANAIVGRTINGTLTLDEFSAFEEYITILIQGHLCNSDGSGVSKIAALLTPYRGQKQAISHQSELGVVPTWTVRELG